MNGKKKVSLPEGGFSLGDSLGGKVSEYKARQDVYKQGAAANFVFYLQEGAVGLNTKSKNRSAITDIMGPGDLFGAHCLSGFPLRVSTATALTACSIRAISKQEVTRMLGKHHKIANSLVSYLLSNAKKNKDQMVDLLTYPAEQRLARVLLRLARLDGKGPAIEELPILSHQVFAEMIGTTRSRVNFFMNKFRRLGYISYDGGLEVHKSLNKVLGSK